MKGNITFIFGIILLVSLILWIPGLFLAQTVEQPANDGSAISVSKVNQLSEREKSIELSDRTEYLKGDRLNFSGGSSANVETNLNKASIPIVGDIGAAGIGINFGMVIREKRPEKEDDWRIVFNTGLGFNTSLGSLYSSGFTGNRLVVTSLFTQVENFFLKGLNLWIGDRKRVSDVLFISGLNYNGDLASLRGIGVDYTHKNKISISLDAGGNWQTRTSYRSRVETTTVAVNEPVYNSSGYPDALEYYTFLDGSNQERIRKIYSFRTRIGFALGADGYSSESSEIALNGKLQLLRGTDGGRYYDEPDESYGTQRLDRVGYPGETGFALGFTFTSNANAGPDARVNNKFMFSFNKSLSVTPMGPGGFSNYFDNLLENRPLEDAYPLVKSDRTVANLKNVIAGDSFQISIKDKWEFTGEAHAQIFSQGINSYSADERGFYLAGIAAYTFNDYWQLQGNTGYVITFPSADARQVLLIKHLQTLTFGLSPILSLTGKQFNWNTIGFDLSSTWYSTGNIPKDPRTGLRITREFGYLAHWQVSVGVRSVIRW